MALNESTIIAGVEVLPSMTEGEKSQLIYTFPQIMGKKVKDKETKAESQKPLVMARRSISDVCRFFPALDDNGRKGISDTQLPAAFPQIAKAVKESGYSNTDFYLGMMALDASLQGEVEQKSGADFRTNLARTLGALFTTDDSIPESLEDLVSLINEKLMVISEKDALVVCEKLKTADEENGRDSSGKIKMVAARTKTEEKPEEKAE